MFGGGLRESEVWIAPLVFGRSFEQNGRGTKAKGRTFPSELQGFDFFQPPFHGGTLKLEDWSGSGLVSVFSANLGPPVFRGTEVCGTIDATDAFVAVA